MPLSLTAKLLRAASQAYEISASGPVPIDAYTTPIGYLAPPDGFAVGDDKIDACLVGETADAIIVACRGTLPPDSPNHGQVILDWATDCDALLVTDPGGLPGKVHQGFLSALIALWPGIEPAITARSAASPAKPIYFTGHSKGGPVANLAAMRMRMALPATTPVMTATFAAARAGDNAFGAAFDAAIPHCARYEYADDIVPHLPPSDEFVIMFRNIPHISAKVQAMQRGYVSVGDLHFIDWNGNLVGDSEVLRFERFASLAKLMMNFGFATIVADHSISPSSGYDKAIDV